MDTPACVLILVVMEEGQRHKEDLREFAYFIWVLILVVMEEGQRQGVRRNKVV